MKKLTAIILSLVMVLAMATVAFAAEENIGSITVEKAMPDQSYSVYQLAVLESYNEGKYSYKITSTLWKSFFQNYDEWFTVEGDYLIVNDYKTMSAEEAVLFGKAALTYAAANSIAPLDTQAADKTGTLVFADLPLGYYLLDSTSGTLCTLDTSSEDLTIQEKNAEPTMSKKVQEDALESSSQAEYGWGGENDANFFQTINYRIDITAQAGAQNYKVHDAMCNGLTLNANSIAVTLNGGNVAATNYTVSTNNEDGCTLEVVFAQTFCDTLESNDQLVITYSAFLNENAEIGGAGNENEAWMTYGQNNTETQHDITSTYVYEFDIVKTDASGVLLSGAEFKLYDAATGGKEIPVVKEADGSYRVAKADETGENIVVSGGTVTVSGLDGSTQYYLEEVIAPAGYNKLTARQAFTIESNNLDASLEGGSYQEGGVQIVNKTGAELPETGGIGTLLFTLLGGGTVLGSGVLLVTKKRMSKIEE